MRRAVQINSISGFCLTKLDVLDGLETLKICTGYQLEDGTVTNVAPLAAEGYEKVTPVYEEMPGWSENTVGATSVDQLPQAALDYIKRIEETVFQLILSLLPRSCRNYGITRPFCIIVYD